MKHFFFLVFFLSVLSSQAFSQDMPFDSAAGKYIYTEVIKVDDVNKEELYTRAREWFFKTYKSPGDILQVQDKDAGQLIGKAVVVIPSGVATYNVNHLITILLKDGRYKYEITDFVYKHNTNGTTYSYDNWKGFGKKTVTLQTDAKMREIIKSLKTAMSTPITAKDDW